MINIKLAVVCIGKHAILSRSALACVLTGFKLQFYSSAIAFKSRRIIAVTKGIFQNWGNTRNVIRLNSMVMKEVSISCKI